MKRRKFIEQTLTGAVATMGLPTIVPSSVFGKNAPSNKINIGQIGCGRIAREHDLAETLKHDSARIIAACDIDRNRLEDAKRLIDGYYGQKTGNGKYMDTKMYDDYREMLLNKDIDAVIVSSADHMHYVQCMSAMDLGKHMYIEKPLTHDIWEARKLTEMAENKKLRRSLNPKR